MHLNRFVIQSVKDMLSIDTIRLALFTGVPISLLWFAIGWIFWDSIVALTMQIIHWIPFSIVRANGAFVIIFFIWFAMTLISYAIFIGLFSGFLLAEKKESRYEAINFTLIFILSLFWAGIIFYFWPTLENRIEYFLTVLPFQTVAEGIAWLLAIYIFYNLFLTSEYLVVFIFREPFIQALMEKHSLSYEQSQNTHTVVAYSKLFYNIALFFLLSIAAIPLLFIPIANFLVIWGLWAWLYKESAFLGVCSLLCSKEEYMRLKEQRLYLIAASFISALLNFIPIISFFTPFFVMTLYFHWILEEKRED